MAKTKKLPPIIKQVQSYKQPFIDFSKQKVISHTQLTIFKNCQYAWGLRYRDGHKINTPSISLIFGTSIHEVFQDYITKFYNESKAAADRMDLETSFKDKLRSKYLEEFKKNNNIHFSDVEEMDEHCLDGLEIIRYFKRKKETYLSKRGWYLVGCEIPINYNIKPNVYYNGFLDVVLYHEPTNTIEIWDLKTSTRAWYDKQKKDESKQAQLLLYKKLFSEQFNFPIDNINIKFLILKRKIKTDGDFPEKRIQEFVPASGKIKVKKANDMLNLFADSTFNEHGVIKTDKFKKTVSKDSCMFCPYKDNDNLCDKNKPLNNKWRNPFSLY
jgi:uncharacterized protein YnzC (UPF0291/DUF896 family)